MVISWLHHISTSNRNWVYKLTLSKNSVWYRNNPFWHDIINKQGKILIINFTIYWCYVSKIGCDQLVEGHKVICKSIDIENNCDRTHGNLFCSIEYEYVQFPFLEKTVLWCTKYLKHELWSYDKSRMTRMFLIVQCFHNELSWGSTARKWQGPKVIRSCHREC